MEGAKLVLSEYENLLRTKKAFFAGCRLRHEKYLSEVRKDLGNEYLDNIEEKITRWIDVTNFMYFRESKPVEFYIQAKMLYRDGFFEATVTMARTICEMICYDLLPHPLPSDIKDYDFRKLLNYIFRKQKLLGRKSKGILHKVYDIGNNYVHPKPNENPRADARECLTKLGQVIFDIYGVPEVGSGMTIQTAYEKFPDICKCYHLLIDFHTSLEDAIKEDALLCLDCKYRKAD